MEHTFAEKSSGVKGHRSSMNKNGRKRHVPGSRYPVACLPGFIPNGKPTGAKVDGQTVGIYDSLISKDELEMNAENLLVIGKFDPILTKGKALPERKPMPIVQQIERTAPKGNQMIIQRMTDYLPEVPGYPILNDMVMHYNNFNLLETDLDSLSDHQTQLKEIQKRINGMIFSYRLVQWFWGFVPTDLNKLYYALAPEMRRVEQQIMIATKRSGSGCDNLSIASELYEGDKAGRAKHPSDGLPDYLHTYPNESPTHNMEMRSSFHPKLIHALSSANVPYDFSKEETKELPKKISNKNVDAAVAKTISMAERLRVMITKYSDAIEQTNTDVIVEIIAKCHSELITYRTDICKLLSISCPLIHFDSDTLDIFTPAYLKTSFRSLKEELLRQQEKFDVCMDKMSDNEKIGKLTNLIQDLDNMLRTLSVYVNKFK